MCLASGRGDPGIYPNLMSLGLDGRVLFVAQVALGGKTSLILLPALIWSGHWLPDFLSQAERTKPSRSFTILIATCGIGIWTTGMEQASRYLQPQRYGRTPPNTQPGLLTVLEGKQRTRIGLRLNVESRIERVLWWTKKPLPFFLQPRSSAGPRTPQPSIHGSPTPASPLSVACVGIEEVHASLKASFQSRNSEKGSHGAGCQWVRALVFLPQADPVSMARTILLYFCLCVDAL